MSFITVFRVFMIFLPFSRALMPQMPFGVKVRPPLDCGLKMCLANLGSAVSPFLAFQLPPMKTFEMLEALMAVILRFVYSTVP